MLFIYPKKDSNLYDFISINLKIILSTYSSTRVKKTKHLPEKGLEPLRFNFNNQELIPIKQGTGD